MGLEECRLPETGVCEYLNSHCSEEFGFARLHFCSNGWLSNETVLISLILVILIALFITIGTITSNFLSKNLRSISNFCGLNEKIAGLTLLSLGNGSTDLFSTYQAMSHNSTSLAVGELIGSSLFLVCFVIGVMGIVKPFQVHHPDFINDLWFFTILVTISFYFLYDGNLRIWECILMCLLYLGYLITSMVWTSHHNVQFDLDIDFTKPIIIESSNSLVVLKSSDLNPTYLKNLQRYLSQNNHSDLISSIKNFHNSEEQYLLANDDNVQIDNLISNCEDDITYRFIHFFQLSNLSIFRIVQLPILLLLKLSIPQISCQHNEINIVTLTNEELLVSKIDERRNQISISRVNELELLYKIKLFNYFQVIVIPLLLSPSFNISLQTRLICSVSGFLLNLGISQLISPKIHLFLIAVVGFVMSLNFITIITAFVINLLKNMGLILNMNESLLGLTILSLGNSIGDLISNITLAKCGLHITGLSACFGAPLLYILLGIGVNGLIIMFRNFNNNIKFEIDSNLLVSCLGLLGILVFYFIVIPRNEFRIGKKIGLVAVIWWGLINMVNVYLALHRS